MVGSGQLSWENACYFSTAVSSLCPAAQSIKSFYKSICMCLCVFNSLEQESFFPQDIISKKKTKKQKQYSAPAFENRKFIYK